MSLLLRTVLAATALACVAPAAALAVPPAVTTGAASELAPDGATVAGSLNPRGLVTTWYFQYGRTTRYGNRTTAQDAGSGNTRTRVTARLAGLAGNTRYHYRLVATNSSGTTRGADRTFRTPEAPTLASINTSPNPVTVLRPVTVTGSLVGPRGGGGKTVALEGNPFPYTAGFQQIGNAVVTNPDGTYTFFFTPFVNLQLRVANRSDPAIVSPILTQNVRSRVTLRRTRRSRRGIVRFHGTILPKGASSVVRIQRRVSRGRWRNVKHAIPRNPSSRQRSTWSKRVRARRGLYRAVARPSGGAYVTGISRRVRVRRR